MSAIDIVGFIGVTFLLAAFFLNVTGKLSSEGLSYILLNLTGAILACLASVWMKYYPFIVLEGIWSSVSLLALWRYLKK